MINKLINLANYLDESGLTKEADRVDALIKTSSFYIILCWAAAGGCKKVSKDEIGIDFEIIYDEDGNPIDVDPACNGNPNDHSCASKETVYHNYIYNTPVAISITWECGDYELLRPVFGSPVGTSDRLFIKLVWQLDEDGYINEKEYYNGVIEPC